MKTITQTKNAFCGLLSGLLLVTAANAREQIYVAEFSAHRVGKYDAATGAAVDANFITGLADPVDFAIRGNDLFVLDRSANRVRRYDARTGAVINADFAIATRLPGGILFNGNDMFLTQYAGSNVARYDATTGALINPTFISGIAGTSWGIQISGSDLYVAEINSHRVRRHDATTGALINANFISQPNYPFGLNVSGSDLFVASLNGPLGRYDVATGTLIYAITGLNGPVDVEKYGSDLLVVESGANRVRRHDAATGALINANFITVQSAPHGMAIRSDVPPTANAGADFSVNEGQTGVMLDGSHSSDPENDPLKYAWTQVPAATVTLTGADTASPTFIAPTVALGGATLTFKLTVTAYGETSEDTVSVTVVNVNHPPVAEAGFDQSIAEGSPVTLHGEDSFDIDNDVFTYAWVQVSGSPTVTITGADTANPTFTAPVVNAGGAPGVEATLVFELTVNDGFPQDAPAPGYTFANVVDSVTVEISNVNNDPTAAAGADQTVDEFTGVTLNGTGSSDPDSDVLTYAWLQTGGPAVLDLLGANTATPSFSVPFVTPGGTDITFELTVDDGYGGTATDTVIVHVQNANDPPLATAAAPTIGSLWPPNHNLVSIGITGVSDADNNATITITGVTQDEPTNGTGDGDTAIDAIINANGTVLLRAERSGNGDGRVYHIHFTASDPEGSASGVVKVTVPHSKKKVAMDGGELYDSTQ